MSTDKDTANGDAEIQGLTMTLVKQAFKHTFPGARFKITDRLGGQVLSSTIWQFSVELSVTERSISFADTEGEATVSVTFRPSAKRPTIVVHQESTTSPTRVWTLVKDTRKYLEGIAAAITMACEEQYYDTTDDIRDLFGE